MRILIVEDEPRMLELLRQGLYEHGFTVMTAADGETGLTMATAHELDALVLDIGLPRLDGCSLLRALRASGRRTPVLMLTARDTEDEIIHGLDGGADDYLTKPFSPRELLLRIKKILSRGEPGEKPRDQMRFGDLLIDVPRHLASWKNRPFELTATEFKLLTTLAQRSGRVQSRDALLRDVWEYDSLIDTRTVDTHMRRLREKLGPASKHLDTVRGVGYRFVE